MASSSHLLRLPVELIVSVFQRLDDIDDALHLARTCRSLYRVFNPSNTRLVIFRSIIENADHHSNDWIICQLEELRARFLLYDKIAVPGRPRFRGQFLRDNMQPSYKEWVPEVVCRWNAMRLLFDWYCDESIRRSFSLSNTLMGEMAWQGGEPLAPPSGILCEGFQNLGPSQKRDSYRRFYKALTSYWLFIEVGWCSGISRVISVKQDDELTGILQPFLPIGPPSWQERLDRLEVIDFVWDFLARKNFHTPALHTWLEGLGGAIRDEYMSGENDEANWALLVSDITHDLRPPHILELLVLSTWSTSRTWKFDPPTYLRRLAFYGANNYDIMDSSDEDDEPYYQNADPPLTMVESELSRWDLEKMPRIADGQVEINDEADWLSRCQHYRRTVWPLEAKGQILFGDKDSQHFFDQVRNTVIP